MRPTAWSASQVWSKLDVWQKAWGTKSHKPSYAKVILQNVSGMPCSHYVTSHSDLSSPVSIPGFCASRSKVCLVVFCQLDTLASQWPFQPCTLTTLIVHIGPNGQIGPNGHIVHLRQPTKIKSDSQARVCKDFNPIPLQLLSCCTYPNIIFAKPPPNKETLERTQVEDPARSKVIKNKKKTYQKLKWRE